MKKPDPRFTIINWCGHGSTLERLFELLATEPLDPTFEEYGNFASNDVPNRKGQGFVRFFGNFYNYSHTFSIDTREPALIERFMKAIKENKATVAYKEAHIERRAYVAKRKAEHEAWMARTS